MALAYSSFPSHAEARELLAISSLQAFWVDARKGFSNPLAEFRRNLSQTAGQRSFIFDSAVSPRFGSNAEQPR
jgi:hypothetical protein